MKVIKQKIKPKIYMSSLVGFVCSWRIPQICCLWQTVLSLCRKTDIFLSCKHALCVINNGMKLKKVMCSSMQLHTIFHLLKMSGLP